MGKDKAAAPPSIWDVLEPMLFGKAEHTREELVAEVRRRRPDLKSPGGNVGKCIAILQAKGRSPKYKESTYVRRDIAELAPLAREARLDKWLARRLAALDAWAERTTHEVQAGFAKLAELRALEAKRPKLRRVWP